MIFILFAIFIYCPFYLLSILKIKIRIRGYIKKEWMKNFEKVEKTWVHPRKIKINRIIWNEMKRDEMVYDDLFRKIRHVLSPYSQLFNINCTIWIKWIESTEFALIYFLFFICDIISFTFLSPSDDDDWTQIWLIFKDCWKEKKVKL